MVSICILFIVLLIQLSLSSIQQDLINDLSVNKQYKDKPVPTYYIDTSKPAKEYLKQICDDFKGAKLSAVYQGLMNRIPRNLEWAVRKLADKWMDQRQFGSRHQSIPEPYWSESKPMLNVYIPQIWIQMLMELKNPYSSIYYMNLRIVKIFVYIYV